MTTDNFTHGVIENEFTHGVIITKELLQSVYDGAKVAGEQYAALGKAVTAIAGGDFVCTVYESVNGKTIRALLRALLGEELYNDWEYLVDECARMDGGGRITVGEAQDEATRDTVTNERTYIIRDVDSLWEYWEKEGLICGKT